MTKNPTIRLTTAQREQIRAALDAAFPHGPGADISEEATETRHTLLVDVRPHEYPEAMYDYLLALATAQIALSDEGLRVSLVPDIPQRYLLVAWPRVGSPIAFLSVKGREQADLNAAVPEAGAADWKWEPYAYDSQEELAEVLEEARRDHPDADFSRVKPLARPVAA